MGSGPHGMLLLWASWYAIAEGHCRYSADDQVEPMLGSHEDLPRLQSMANRVISK